MKMPDQAAGTTTPKPGRSLSQSHAPAEETDTCSSADKLASFVEIAQKHRARLISLAWRMTSRREEAEDIVQEALLKAFRALPRFRGDSRMDTWLHTIVRNAALEHLRKQKGKIELPLEPPHMGDGNLPVREFPDPGKTPEECCEHRELEEVLRSGMNEVTCMCRLALEMCVLEELPYRAVASDLNVSINTLKSRVFHGKRMLRRAVRQRTCQQANSIAAFTVGG